MDDLLRRRRRTPRPPASPTGVPSLARAVLDPTADPPPRFVPFSGTTARLTLAVHPDDLAIPDDQPCAADVYAWEFSSALLHDEAENPYAAFESPDRCRLGVDVPAILGFGPLDPGTARALAAAPPPYLRVVLGDGERAARLSDGPSVPTSRAAVDAVGDSATVGTSPSVVENVGSAPAHGTGATDPSRAALSDAGRERTGGYVPGARLAREVRREHPTCVAPSCHVPATACDLDHVVPWPAGPTSAENLRPLCRHHHLVKTHLDHELWLTADGTAVWRTPEGHTYRRPAGGESRLDEQEPVRAGAA